MAPGMQSLKRTLARAAQLPVVERPPDVAAFIDSATCLREVCQLLPIDAEGRPTIKDATTARRNTLLAAAKTARAHRVSVHAPVADCEWWEPLHSYLARFGGRWASAAERAALGGAGIGTEDDETQLGAVLHLYITGRGPDAREATRRAALAATLLTDSDCFTAVGRQLAQLMASQPQPRGGSRPPLLTAQELQAVCCRHAAEVAYAVATLQRNADMRPPGFKPLTEPELAAMLEAQERCARQLLALEPNAAWSHVAACLALRARGQAVASDAELAERYLRAAELARAARSGFLQARSAADGLGAAFLHCSRRGDASSAARLEAALAAFEQAQLSQQYRRYLPDAWLQALEASLAMARSQVAPCQALLQYVRSAGAGGSGTSGPARLEGPAAPTPAQHSIAPTSGGKASRENVEPSQHSSCAGCGRAGEGFRRCARCKVARYCGRDCQAAHWPKHRRQCQQQAT